MIGNLRFILKVMLCIIPLVVFMFLNRKSNLKRDVRYKQFPMPVAAIVYCILLFIFMTQISGLLGTLIAKLSLLFEKLNLKRVGQIIRKLHAKYALFVLLFAFNIAAMAVHVILKRIITLFCKTFKIGKDSFPGKLVSFFYTYDEDDGKWYVKPHLCQARSFLKYLYYGSVIIVFIAFIITCLMLKYGLISAPFYPVFALIIIGEFAFYIDGESKAEAAEKTISMSADSSERMANYSLLRKPLRNLFGDKLLSDGTTFSDEVFTGGPIDDILSGIEEEGGHTGKNYSLFIRSKMENGLRPDADYVRSGYDLATGKSLLFNTPFYDKLIPYAFYAMNHSLLRNGKVLIVLGTHGTTEDLISWCRTGMRAATNVSDLWKIGVLNGKRCDPDDLPDIGIISRSGVHDLEIHRANLEFLKKVGFIFIVEPSKLVTTAQIGLNLLIKCCGADRQITFCSVDRNCDGLVDALSHILMTNITEVSATEYPRGMSSYMCWAADSDYIQHRIVPGVSRYLGMGTELSMVALKNQVPKSIWYGGEVYPVLDAHWIAKQYYYDLLDYASLPATQETFDKCFRTSFNMCNERLSDFSYVIVEDERNNVFETKRNFSTISLKQGFVNVISPEYMLREYMTENNGLFTADAKAIPYFAADYARTKRNSVLTLCLKLCVDGVSEDELKRELLLMGYGTDDPETVLWNEICVLFGVNESTERDGEGNPIITVPGSGKAKDLSFRKASTILFSRRYSVDLGAFESVYSIDNKAFAEIILDDLRNASYIAEREGSNSYIGTELKGHIYQKYLPGQFFTLNGKYYEMVSVTADNRILVRRASEHINGRQYYRQVRSYVVDRLADSDVMGALKTINDVDVYYQFADFRVETSTYWRMRSYNDFANGDKVELNGVPSRRYYNKQLLKLDFSKLGDAFTDRIRKTLTAALNEVFVTLFAENSPFVLAVTPGEVDIPLTYSIEFAENCAGSEKAIYIIEDSQLDIGLLVSVERNIGRILQIVSDYLAWNDEMIEQSLNEAKEESAPAENVSTVSEALELIEKNSEQKEKKKNVFSRFFGWIGSLFKKKDKKGKGKEKAEGEASGEGQAEEPDKPKKEKGGFFGKLFGRKKKKDAEDETPAVGPAPAEGEASGEGETSAEGEKALPAEEKPEKKGGFFGKLFGKKNKKKKNAEPAEGETPAETPAEGAEPEAEKTAEKPKKEKGGFFGKLFGKKKKKSKEVSGDAPAEEPGEPEAQQDPADGSDEAGVTKEDDND